MLVLLRGVLAWLAQVLGVWGDELRVVASGRRHLVRRIVLVGLLQTIALQALGLIVPGFHVAGWGAAVAGIAAIALLNAGLWPILLYLTLPLTVLTFGLFSVALNALLLVAAARLVPGLAVGDASAAVWAGIGLAAVNTAVSILFDAGDDESFTRQVLARAIRRQQGAQTPSAVPGLALVQIDGLGADVLQSAISTGKMPTLASWLGSGSHRLVRWQCALPSQTSASQAGILYGTNFDIPAFRWYDKDTRRLVVSNRPADAASISKRLSDGHGLLHPSGSSVSNLFDGDAERSVLTLSSIGASVREPLRSRDVFAYLVDPYAVLRTLVLMLWEVIVEIWQAQRQRLRDVRPRVARGGAFPLIRAVCCVLLRDLTTALIVDDLQRGVPITYADFVAYDELAHHAGPERPEALTVLRHLDRQIALLEQAARQAPRPYALVVLSDHGQTLGAPFRQRAGQTLDQLLQHLVGPAATVAASAGSHEGWGQVNALLSEAIAVPGRALGRALARLLRPRTRDGYVELGPDGSHAPGVAGQTVVCASGNLGLVYFTDTPQRLTREAIDRRHPDLIQCLVDQPGIGLLLVRSETQGALVLGRGGQRWLADDRIEGRDPLADFGPLAADHLRRLDSFPHTGDLVVISEVDANGDVAAFEELVGSHGGLGGPQTSPFLLVPADWTVDEAALVGAPSIYSLLCRYRDGLEATPATPAASSQPG